MCKRTNFIYLDFTLTISCSNDSWKYRSKLEWKYFARSRPLKVFHETLYHTSNWTEIIWPQTCEIQLSTLVVKYTIIEFNMLIVTCLNVTHDIRHTTLLFFLFTALRGSHKLYSCQKFNDESFQQQETHYFKKLNIPFSYTWSPCLKNLYFLF